MKSSRMDVNKKAEIVRAQFGRRDTLFGTDTKLPKLVELRLKTIRLNPDQPRKTFDETGLEELASSIEQHGLLLPVKRRYAAVHGPGRTTITAMITDGNAGELAVIENLQRADLRPLEQAAALARLMDAHGYTQELRAKVIGKARTTVTELLQLT